LSFLGRVPAASLIRLFDDTLNFVVPAGGVIHPEGGPPFAMLVVGGPVRIVASSPDGRQATIRYARSGAQLGFGSLFSALPNVVAAVALRDTRVVVLRPGRAREVATTDPAIAGALLSELSDRIIAYQGEMVGLAAMITAPPAPFVPADLHSRPAVAIATCHSGDASAGKRPLRPVKALGPSADLLGAMPYNVLQTMLDQTAPAGQRRGFPVSAGEVSPAMLSGCFPPPSPNDSNGSLRTSARRPRRPRARSCA
jgi:hypothetical protein